MTAVDWYVEDEAIDEATVAVGAGCDGRGCWFVGIDEMRMSCLVEVLFQ